MRIKPLQWEESQDGDFRAQTPFGSLFVERKDFGGWTWGYCFDEYYDENSESCDDPEEGKRRAEEHWNDRISECLEFVTLVIPEHATEKDGVWSWFVPDPELEGSRVFRQWSDTSFTMTDGDRKFNVSAPFTPGETVAWGEEIEICDDLVLATYRDDAAPLERNGLMVTWHELEEEPGWRATRFPSEAMPDWAARRWLEILSCEPGERPSDFTDYDTGKPVLSPSKGWLVTAKETTKP